MTVPACCQQCQTAEPDGGFWIVYGSYVLCWACWIWHGRKKQEEA